nr:PREDICTED: uncharacterized protein LOC109033101 [Bemisia tabaci]
MEEPFRIENDWHCKLLMFFLRLHGLHFIYFGEGLLSRSVLYIRSAIIGLQCFFLLHSLASILMHITQETPVQVRVLSHYSQYVGVSLYSACRNYSLLSRRVDIAYLLKDSCRVRLHSAEIDIAPFWRKHTLTLSIFWIGYMLTANMVGVGLLGVVSPFLRFVVRQEKPTFILRRVWYPKWVYSSPMLCWCLAIYEGLLIFDTSLALLMPDMLYLYLAHTTVVKLEALGQFFADSFEKTGRESNSSGLTRASVNENNEYPHVEFTGNREKGHEHKMEAFKKGIVDWHILRRESHLINSVYTTNAAWAVMVGVSNNTLMSYLAVTELMSSGASIRTLIHGVIFFYHAFTGTFMMYSTSYAATLLREAHVNLRHSLYRCDWFSENLEFKKLFLCFNLPMFCPVQITVLRVQPYNLETFSLNLSRAFSYVRFLLQLSRTS